MKTKILLLTLLLSKILNVNGQINLEATYDSAAMNLYMVTLEVEGEKFVKVQQGDSAFRFISFYNLNHSLWKTIDCNSFPIYTFLPMGGGTFNSARFNYDVLYISEHLFNSDDQIEFLYTVYTGFCPQYFTGIYNEFGTPIMLQDSASPLLKLNIPIVAKPIYNTASGTKMILSFPCTKEAKVYSLPGILTTTNIHAPENTDSEKSLLAYPNPSSNRTTIEYKLPPGIQKGEIIIYDLSGTEIKKYSIDTTFSNLVLDNNDLPSGTYLYSLKANEKILGTQKIVVIN